MVEPGAVVGLDITGFTADGDGLAFLEGQEIRVFGALPGESLTAEITLRKRKYLFAEVKGLSVASPRRVEPACEYFAFCTGCQWQHLDYSFQLEMKTDKVRKALQDNGLEAVLVRPALGADNPWHYRNHARFTVWRDGSVGYVHRETRRLIAIESCMIMHPWINGTLSMLQGKCRNMTQMSVRYGVNSGQWLIQPKLEIPGVDLASGQSHYEEVFCGHTVRISSPSFFQVNNVQAEKLVSTVLHYVVPTGCETVVDAYTGVGTFAIALSEHVAVAVAIEESYSAIKDAQANLSGLSNVKLIQSKVEDALAEFPVAPDAVILDPPRSGCHQSVLKAMGICAPKKLVYVSCDPETLARDMAVLCRNGFDAVEVQPIDMFPQTHRVECVAFLESRRKVMA